MTGEARTGTVNSLAARRRDFVAGEIRSVALALFAQRGFDSVTVDDIAAAAGISQRTFFRYFASKDDVVLRYSRALMDRLCDAVAARPPTEGAVTALREAFVDTSTVLPGDRATVRLQAGVLTHHAVLHARSEGERLSSAPLVALLADRMGADPVADERPSMVAASLTAVAGVAFTRWVTSGDDEDPAQAVARAIDLVIAGVAHLDTTPPHRGGRRKRR